MTVKRNDTGIEEPALEEIASLLESCMKRICCITDPRTKPNPTRRGFYGDFERYECTRDDLHFTGHKTIRLDNGVKVEQFAFTLPAIPMLAARLSRFQPWMRHAKGDVLDPDLYEPGIMAGPQWAGVVGFEDELYQRRSSPVGMQKFEENKYQAAVSREVHPIRHGNSKQRWYNEHRLLLSQSNNGDPPSATLMTGLAGPPKTVKYNGVYRSVLVSDPGRVLEEIHLELTAKLDLPSRHHPQARLATTKFAF